MTELLGLLTLLAVALVAVLVLLAAILVREARNPPRHTAAYAVARNLPCDPGDLGLEFESWTLDRSDGVRLPVWEIAISNEPKAESRKPTAVLVHGWGQSKIDMLTRLAPWDQWCSRLVLYDLRGHGDAQGGPSRLGAGEEHDLLDLIRRLGNGPVVLVGHSMGAVIALHAAAIASDVRERIIGTVAFGPYADFHASLRRRLQGAGYPTRPVTDLAMAWLRLTGIRHRRIVDDAAALACPLLVIHGRQDPISPFAHAELLVDAAADSALHAIEDGGHLDAHEVDGEAVMEAIQAFAERVAGEPGTAARW